MIGDLLFLMVGMVGQLWRTSHAMFLTVLALGMILGGVAWWLTRWVALSYNRQFFFHPHHHIFCGAAAIITIWFTILFSALSYTGMVAEFMVDRWKEGLLQDREWSQDTFRQAYEAVYELRDASGKQLENFANYPHPDSGLARLIPTNHAESKQMAAQTYAKGVVDHFRFLHPFLSKILWANPQIAQQVVTQDMERVFGSGSRTYQADDAIQLASEKIRQVLREQVPRIVIISRLILLGVFLLVQGMTVGLLIKAALDDIKEHRSPSRYVGG